MVDMWLLVGKVSAKGQLTNSAFRLFGVGKWVVIHVITWIAGITGVQTIKRQIWAACGYLAARSKVPCEQSLAYGL